MSYHYRNRGMASLGGTQTTTYWATAQKQLVTGSDPSKWTNVGPLATKGPFGSLAEAKASVAGLTAGGLIHSGGKRYFWLTKTFPRVSTAAFAAPVATSFLAPVMALVRPPAAPNVASSGPVSTPSIGGGGSSGQLPSDEIDEVVMTPQGPAPLAVRPVSSFPVRPALIVGGGLLVAYLLFGRKRA